MTILMIIYTSLFIFPLSGLVWLGIINERRRLKKISLAIWRNRR